MTETQQAAMRVAQDIGNYFAKQAEPVADRAAFERHAERLGYSVDPDTREGREGGYWSSHTQLMWLTWQAALAEPVQEPVAWRYWKDKFACWEYSDTRLEFPAVPASTKMYPLYAAPPQRKPLTEKQINHILDDVLEGGSLEDVARAVEAAHGIKGGKMTDRIFVDANGGKYINNEPRLHPSQRKPPATIDDMFARMDKAPRGVFSGHDPMTMWMEAWRAAEQHHGIK